MTETPYIKNDEDEILVVFQDGKIPMVGLMPLSGGVGVKFVGDTFNKLSEIAGNLQTVKNFLNTNSATAKIPKISQLDLTLKDTEYLFIFPALTKKYYIRNRNFTAANSGDNIGEIRYAYEPGLVASALFDETNNNSFGVFSSQKGLFEDRLNLNQALTIYFASDTNNVPLTIEYWT